MTKIDMTHADYAELMEASAIEVEAPSDTILTKQNDFKSDASGKPLSGIDGDGGAMNKPHEEGKAPKDAPATPTVASMGEPTRMVSVGSKKKAGKKSPAKSDKTDSTKKPTENKTDGDNKPWDKKEGDEMSEHVLTMEDFDFDSTPCDKDRGHKTMMGEEEGVDGISVSREFLSKLLNGVAAASMTDEQIDTVVDAIEQTGGGKTLDVIDIEDVMAALHNMTDDTAGADDYADEDIAMGDGEPAGDEGGEEFEGETKLMGGEDRTDVKEAWLSSIPHAGNKRKKANYKGLTDEEVEIRELKRLAGM